MRMGKHVYCQKPLTQTIYEARYLREPGARKPASSRRWATRAAPPTACAARWSASRPASSARCTQVHVWTNRPIWPQGMDRPDGSDPVPATLDWDIWIGPGPDAALTRRKFTSRSTGAAGRISARARSATWPATRSTCRSARLNLGYPTEIEADAIRRDEQRNLSHRLQNPL